MKKSENKVLLKYIQEVVQVQSQIGKWDNGPKENNNLTEILIYEYATSLEKITKGKITSQFVVDKLTKQLGTLRYGDFQKGIDDNITYDNYSVTSITYKQNCRINSKFGAHTIDYLDDNQEKSAIVLFDNKQTYLNDQAKTIYLSGINLDDLFDIRLTIFHEFTHIMEQVPIKTSNLTKQDIVYYHGNSIYINTKLSPSLTIEEYKKYIDNVEELLTSNATITYSGITTIEINNNTNKRIMHNQISEGATEYIAKLVMQELNYDTKKDCRYAKAVNIIKSIFASKGISESVTTYLTSPKDIIVYLESIDVEGKDLLHYISEQIINK